MGSKDFSLGFWFNKESHINTQGLDTLFSIEGDSNHDEGHYSLKVESDSSNAIVIDSKLSDGTSKTITSDALQNGQWYHLGLIKRINTLSLYINGQLVSSNDLTGQSYVYDNSFYLTIGARFDSNFFNGYIQDLRFLKAKAINPNVNFNLQEFSSVTCAKPCPELVIRSTNSTSSIFKDSSLYKNEVIVQGNVAHSNGRVRFGGSSLYFDGNKSALQVQYTENLNIQNGFTLQFWVFIEGSGDQSIISMQKGNTTVLWEVLFNELNNNIIYNQNGNEIASSETKTFKNSWRHVAVSSDLNQVTIFIDGQAGQHLIDLALLRTKKLYFQWAEGSLLICRAIFRTYHSLSL